MEQIVRVVEGVKGERWEAFRDRHGDWGRDLVLYLGRRHGGLRLMELGRAAGHMDYAAVSAAVQRLTRRLRTDKALAAKARQAKGDLLKVET